MKKNIIIAILALISIGLVVYIVYDKMNDKENIEVEKDDSISYHFEETPIIGTIIDSDKYAAIPLVDSNGNIKLSYPEIKYDSKEIENLNNTIKTKINKNIDELNNYESVGDVPTCLTIKMNNSNENITFDHFVYSTYELMDNSNYISILEFENGATTCAGGWVLMSEVYIIDKDSKQLITQDTVKENNDDMIQDLLKYIKNENEEEYYNHVKNEIDQNKYFIYYKENNNVVVSFKSITGSYNEKYEYNGTSFSKLELY